MKVKKCIIPIAGKGTRRLPITKTISKEMLPILNEPSIMLIVKECLKSGIEEIIFVVNEDNKDLIKDFFTKNLKLEEFLDNDKKELLKDINEIISKIKFHYVIQNEKIRGTGGAIYAAREYINKEFFAVCFGDDLIDSEKPYLKSLLDECEMHDCNVLGVMKVDEKLLDYYYVIKYKHDNVFDYFVKDNKEKSFTSNHMMLGRLVLNYTVFDKILNCKCHENNEYFISDVIDNINEEIRTILCDGVYYNIGNIKGFVKANIAYSLKNDKIKEELLNFIKDEFDKKKGN